MATEVLELHLSTEVKDELARAAEAAGVPLDEYAARLITEAVAPLVISEVWHLSPSESAVFAEALLTPREPTAEQLAEVRDYLARVEERE